MAETSPSFTVTMNDGKSAKPEQPVPEPASKQLTWTSGKQTIKYTATAEMLPLHTDDGTLIGHMFALSYVSDAADKSDRPVTFCWNGGPGGSSAMVNIGGLGPRRVPINTIKQLPCPTKPEDNPYSLLPTTDLVYLDAMGTGYSKVAEGYDPKKVWGVDGDADAFMRGIAQWLTTHERWNTPLYLYGESYGTMRNSVLMRVLGERGIALTGVIEQSTILDYAPTSAGNDLYYMGMLPVYAATANYFGKAGAGVRYQFAWFDRAWKFVDEKYGRAHRERLHHAGRGTRAGRRDERAHRAARRAHPEEAPAHRAGHLPQDHHGRRGPVHRPLRYALHRAGLHGCARRQRVLRRRGPPATPS